MESTKVEMINEAADLMSQLAKVNPTGYNAMLFLIMYHGSNNSGKDMKDTSIWRRVESLSHGELKRVIKELRWLQRMKPDQYDWIEPCVLLIRHDIMGKAARTA